MDFGHSETSPLHQAGNGQKPLLSPNQALKQLYRHELDQILRDRDRIKKLEKQKEEQQRKTYNQRLEHLEEMDKMKDISYKNYYQMLMEGQRHNLETYISPFAKRDAMKQEHINHAIEDQRKKSEQDEVDRARRQYSMKESYRKGLLQQLEQRNNLESRKRIERQQEKEAYNRVATLPKEVEQWEKQKKRQDTNKYREELERGINDKQVTQMRTIRQKGAAFYPKTPDNHHNPLYNPLPYNIQNPYILRELQRNGMGPQPTPSNSYLAGVAANNLERL